MSIPGVPPPSPLPPADPPEFHDLATPEEIAARRRRRRLVLAGVVAVILAGFGAVGGRPAGRAIKGWQARRAAAEATRLLAAGHPTEAVTKLQDALSLRHTDPEVMRAAARFLTRLGRGREAVGFWKEIEKGRALTRDEQRDYAADLLATGDLAAAAPRLRLAWPEGTDGTPDDWSLGLEAALGWRDLAAAETLARRLIDPRSVAATDRQRLQGAVALLNTGVPGHLAAGNAFLRSLADGGGSPESLEALLLLARQAAQTVVTARARRDTPPEADVQAVLDLAGRIETHPRAKATQQFLASQLRAAAQPDRRAALVQEAVDRYGHSRDDEELTALGGWLYAQGEFQRVLDVIPPERATTSRALYFQYLDALGALGRWDQIRRAIEGQQVTLDPMIEQMYLARCATMLKQPESAELHWAAAIRGAGPNPEKLVSLGRYAQENGALGTAEAVLRAAQKASPEYRPAHEALLGLLGAGGRTRAAWESLQAMLTHWPQDAAVRNDRAYLGALLGEELTADRDTARELVRAEGGNAPHRVTLALAELRLGHALTALDALRPIGAAVATQPKFLAVYAAALRAAGFEPEARQAAGKVNRDQLLPEERQLLDGLRTDG